LGTALVGGLALIAMTWVGGWGFAGFMAALALLAQREVFNLFASDGKAPGNLLAALTGMALVLGPVWPPAWWLAVPLGIGSLSWFFLRRPHPKSLAALAGAVVGLVYPGAFLAALVAVRLAGPSVAWDPFVVTMGLFLLTWMADTAAYYAGRTLGRHPLAPLISPKKTWEGAAGGLLGCMALALGMAVWWGGSLAMPHWLALGGIVGIVGPAGDLFESALKRAAGVKDSGSVLPGHGGMLDRFDALIFVAPLAAAYLFAVA
jgi:phosphatidate cytidylyltransferase